MTIRSEVDIEAALVDLSRRDERLVRVVELAGPVPLRRSSSGLAGLSNIVVSQQVSKASAKAIFSRLCLEVDIGDAASFLAVEEEAFRRAGLSRPKQRTMLAICQSIVDGRLDFARVESASAEEAIAEMTAISGIGPWTAECYLLFCAGHADIFPGGDLALQAAVGHAFAHETRPGASTVKEIAALWSPYRSVAARLFWAYYGAVNRRDAAPTPVANQPG